MKLAVTFALAFLVGCGTPPMTTNDAGAPDDRPTPVDAGTTDTGPVTICHPDVNANGTIRTCAGAPLCQPNDLNPTCAGAMACTCNLTAADMPTSLCTAETMPACMSAVSCTVGHNHCSINLPPSVDYAPFTMLNPSPLGHGGLTRTILEDWRQINTASGTQNLHGNSLYSSRGFVQICGRLTADIGAIPPELWGQGYCAECSGTTCYWNRGALRDRAPSIEISLSGDACGMEIRYYAAGVETPSQTISLVSLSNYCN